MRPQETPGSYKVLVSMAVDDRMCFLFPAKITRTITAGPDGPVERVHYDGGLQVRYSGRLPVEVDLHLMDGLSAHPQPHVSLPLMWSWAVGQRKKLPMHPAGEWREPFKERFP